MNVNLSEQDVALLVLALHERESSLVGAWRLVAEARPDGAVARGLSAEMAEIRRLAEKMYAVEAVMKHLNKPDSVGYHRVIFPMGGVK